MRTIAEVVEDIKNGTWGSDIEYQSECEKLHKLCDEILEIEKAKMERVVAELEELANHYHKCCLVDYNEGAEVGVRETMAIVRKGGVE